MVLTKEQRIELLAKARAAKQTKNKKETPEPEVVVEPPPPEPPAPKPKKSNKKSTPQPQLPVPVQVIEESDDEEEVIEVPIPAPKPKKKLPVRWLKKQEEPVKVCCDELLTKEEPLITDEKPNKVLVDKHIVIPPEKELKKPRKPRASATAPRTLELTPIEDVFEDIQNNDVKYRPVPKIKAQPAPPEVVIKHNPLGFTLFDY